MRNQQKYENLTYLVLWSLLFMAPVLSLYIRSATDSTLVFQWDEVFMVWRQLLFFFVAFVAHNFLLAPLLIWRGRRWTYFALVAVMVAGFTLWQCSNKPDHHSQPPRMEHPAEHPMEHPAEHPMEHPAEHPMEHPAEHPMEHQGPPPHDMNQRKPPVMMGEHDIVAVIVLILMLGMNLGVKLYFKQLHDQRQLAEQERQNLEQQLEYLRYQINPHFFMNTLNNIHALVDIDPEKAKHVILELSKMMRFVLYEGDKKTVPLSNELSFLRNYITLMSLRYTDKVDIKVSLPDELPASEVPPLLFVTFVENAFKHGVSYQQQSFVDIQGDVTGNSFFFRCVNSKVAGRSHEGAGEAAPAGGVGLRNARKRLDIIYGNRYTLDISDTSGTYAVELVIPLEKN